MPTATRSKPGSKRRPPVKPAAAKIETPKHNPTTRAAAEIEADLTKAREKLGKLDTQDDDKCEALYAAIAELESEFDSAQIASLPPVPDASRLPEPIGTREIELEKIIIGGNHRERMSGPEIERLARSMQSFKLLEPIGVQTVSGADTKFVLIWGARRLAAAQHNNWQMITAKVYPSNITPEQVEILRSVENLYQEDLTPVGRALAVARMISAVNESMGDGGPMKGDWELAQTVQAAGGVEAYVAQYIGHPVKWVKDHAYVANLTGPARDLLSQRRLDLGHARELAKLGDPAASEELAFAAARSPQNTGGKSVEWLRDRVSERMLSLKRVPWRLEVAFAKDAAKGCEGWACVDCRFNSNHEPGLFGGDAAQLADGSQQASADDDAIAHEPGSCSNAPCFAVKQVKSEELLSKAIDKIRAKVKNPDDAGRIALNKADLTAYCPPEIKIEALVKRARAEIDPDTGKRPDEADGKATNAAKPDRKEPTAEQKAEKKAAADLEKWRDAAAAAILAAVQKEPLRALYFLALRDARKLEAIGDADDPKRRRKAEQAAVRGELPALFKHWKNPSLSDLRALAKQLQPVSGKIHGDLEMGGIYRYEISRLVIPAIQDIAEKLGVKLAEMPVVADFSK